MSSQASNSKCNGPKIGLIIVAVFSALMALQSLAIVGRAAKKQSADLDDVHVEWNEYLARVENKELLPSDSKFEVGFQKNYTLRTEYNKTWYIVWALVWFLFMTTHSVLTSLLAYSFSVWKRTHTMLSSAWIFFWTLISLFFLICDAKPADVYGMSWTVLADSHSGRKGLAYTLNLLALVLYPLCWYFCITTYPEADDKGTYHTIEESDDEAEEV